MGWGRSFWEQMAEGMDFSMEPMPGQPILEVAGEHRVLMENHRGVKGYSREKVWIRVKFGMVCIHGCDLELVHMTRERLLISGRIDGITLLRGE